MALTDKLTAIGNAIREKNGTTELIPLVDMPQAILDIKSSGEVEPTELEQTLYDFYEVSRSEYPYLVIYWNTLGAAPEQYTRPKIYFGKEYAIVSNLIKFKGYVGCAQGNKVNYEYLNDGLTLNSIVDATMQSIEQLNLSDADKKVVGDVSLESDYIVTNIPIDPSEYNPTIFLFSEPIKSEIDIVEDLIDNSGVLDSTEGSITEKVEQLIELVESEGIKLNIAYGITPPDDTSKLWIKANEPQKLIYSNNIEGVERVEGVPAYLSNNSAYTVFTAKVENRIYAFVDTDAYIYKPETNLVTHLEDIWSDRIGNGYCYVEDKKIYIFSHINNIYVFDTETNTATKLATQTGFKKVSNGMCRVGNKVYSFGGSSSKDIIIFDMETKTSTTLSVTLPVFCYGMCCEAYGTKIYLLGGYGGTSSSNYTYRNHIYVFDTETDTITRLRDADGNVISIPEPCSDMGSCRIGTKIYLFGGSTDSGRVNTINVFDVETETVETLDVTLPKADTDIGCCGDGTKVYLFGGYSYPEAINVLNLTHQLNKDNIEIETDLLKNKFNLINTNNAQVEVGVKNVYIGNENNEAELCEAYLHNGTEWQQI